MRTRGTKVRALLVVATVVSFILVVDKTNLSEESLFEPYDEERNDERLSEPFTESSEKMDPMEKRMQDRKFQRQKACSQLRENSSHNVDTIRPGEFIITNQSLVWCNVFKAGSTSLVFMINQLSGKHSLDWLSNTKTPLITVARNDYPHPNLDQMRRALKNPDSVSFLNVRHPIDRLFSAYNDKILRSAFGAQHYILGKKIIRRYRRQIIRELPYKNRPTFDEFVMYILDTAESPDMHWAPMYSFCSVCSVNYDLIVKMETFDEDLDYLLKISGLANKVKIRKLNVRSRGNHGSQKALDQFSSLNPELKRRICDYYYPDFVIFNYSAKECSFLGLDS